MAVDGNHLFAIVTQKHIKAIRCWVHNTSCKNSNQKFCRQHFKQKMSIEQNVCANELVIEFLLANNMYSAAQDAMDKLYYDRHNNISIQMRIFRAELFDAQDAITTSENQEEALIDLSDTIKTVKEETIDFVNRKRQDFDKFFCHACSFTTQEFYKKLNKWLRKFENDEGFSQKMQALDSFINYLGVSLGYTSQLPSLLRGLKNTVTCTTLDFTEEKTNTEPEKDQECSKKRKNSMEENLNSKKKKTTEEEEQLIVTSKPQIKEKAFSIIEIQEEMKHAMKTDVEGKDVNMTCSSAIIEKIVAILANQESLEQKLEKEKPTMTKLRELQTKLSNFIEKKKKKVSEEMDSELNKMFDE